MLHHGGDVVSAAGHFGIAADQWLDLSTGINPDGYPAGGLTARDFQQLPSALIGQLEASAGEYFQAEQVVIGAGSQAMIQQLPALYPPSRVAVPDIGYQEHAYCWQRAGHQLCRYDGFAPNRVQGWIDSAAVDHVVVINPNNPTTARVSREQLLQWRDQLAVRGGSLLVDEAFIDAEVDREDSVARDAGLPGLMVLRSLGKFWGLAGLRVGFGLCDQALATTLRAALGPWPVAGPSARIAAAALSDRDWQQQARSLLQSQRQRMQNLWQEQFPALQQTATALFVTLRGEHEQMDRLWQQLAQGGILLRQWPEHRGLLRCGWPSACDESAWQRLAKALEKCALTRA